MERRRRRDFNYDGDGDILWLDSDGSLAA